MLRRLLIATTAAAVLPVCAFAQQGTTRVVPQNRADQDAPAVRERQAPAPSRPRQSRAGQALKPFVLRAIDVTGSTLPSEQLQAAAQPFIGQTLDAAGIQKLSDALAATYEKSNVAIYTVLVPDQDPSAGTLKIKVLEGRVERVDLDASQAGKAAALVQRHADRLPPERPLSRSTLQREISLIRDIPGLNTDMQLLNGSGDDSVVIKLKPDLKRVQVGLAINNRGTAFLGRTQVQGDLYLNSVLRGGDQTRFTVAAPTDGDLFRFGAVSHSTPLGSNGDQLQLTGSYLETRPAGTALEGHASSFGLQITRPVVRSYDNNLYVTLGLDGVNADNALFGTRFSDDRSRAGRLAAAWSRTLPKSVFVIVASGSVGIDDLGARTATPAFTELDFKKVNLRVSYARALGDQFALRLKAAGQASSDLLPGSEQFALGGTEYGRAYESAVVAGDRGYAGSAEIAWRPNKLPKVIGGSEVYGFVDGGRTTLLSRGGFAQADYRLGSAGAGVRINIRDRLVVEAEAAKGLSSNVAFLDDRDWRGVVSVRTLF